MTRVTCRLTAKNRDHLRNPTLGNRVWATFFYKVLCFTVLCAALFIVLCIVPMDLDVNMKAVLLGAVFLVVSKTAVLDYLAAVKRDFPELCQKLFPTSFSVYQFLD